MKKLVLIFSLILLSSFELFSCLNYYYSLNKEGDLVPLGLNWKFPFNKNFKLESNVSKLKKLENKLRKEKNYMLLSDYSVCLMKLGKQKEALGILKELYRAYPNEYKIAANLGTAYELNGEVDSALKYIKRNLQLNPHDHDGSEWIHARILETKLKLTKDANYLKVHSVLQLSDKQKNDSLVLQQIAVQLQERIPFTPADGQPNELMASLLIDLGDISANIRSIEYARAYYLIAKNYYASNSPGLNEKIREMEKLKGKYSTVAVERAKLREQTNVKVGQFKYTELLTDNSDPNYKINWELISTDVPTLLALADLTKPASEVKTAAQKDTMASTEDGLKFANEHDHSDTLAQSKNDVVLIDKTVEKNYTLYYIIGGVILIGLGALFAKRLKK